MKKEFFIEIIQKWILKIWLKNNKLDNKKKILKFKKDETQLTKNSFKIFRVLNLKINWNYKNKMICIEF